ncbi:hypothetical protein [Thalassotalea atypica]|uniref:hypothetical protein n=1 Tax=Thalassotalea atypica TaxID=2054316 RepID=UPI0025723F9D|nr:hypothetical protein [Thalassotalea atypica]
MESNRQNRSLVKATLISLIVAAIVLVLFILPAEYNIDPTGVGQSLGLTVFNEVSEDTSVVTNGKGNSEEDAVVITVPAGRGVEYKLAMEQFKKVTYEWVTDGSDLYVDLHGEPKGDTTGYFESYTIATVHEMNGSFTAPYTGSHGWYWKNKSDQDVKITLSFSGDYVIEGLK